MAPPRDHDPLKPPPFTAEKAVFPRSEPEKDLPLWLADPEADPALTDKFRRIKYQLQALKARENLKVFAFASPHGRAGVSTILSHCALVMSWDLLDQNFLVVDAHLGRPLLHRMFGVNPAPGLWEYVTQGQTLTQVCQATFRPNLDVVVAGQPVPEVSSPFDLRTFSQLLVEGTRLYDFVLVDCPPVFEDSSAKIICSKVEGVVLVGEANRLRQEVLRACLRELGENARMVGTILNKREMVIPPFLYRLV
uniref:Tyrosine-protein kinase family protein n=1 Tax=Desulfobacca acetoxidans TaxID=60893 RepID=A0A7V4GAA7_9BACT